MAEAKLNPAAAGIFILVVEVLVFLTVTAFMTYFISYASAPLLAPGAEPPADFPVIGYDGNRDQPDPRHYFVVPWGEWAQSAEKRPAASLLLPEPSATVALGEAGEVSFSATDAPGSRQAVDLKWRTGSSEHHVGYLAEASRVEPRYFRTINTRTFLLGALVGFGVGLLVGKALRRRLMPWRRLGAPPPAEETRDA